MSTVKVTCGHVELGKKVVCAGCFEKLEAENRRLTEHRDNLVWNLAGCDTFAMGYKLDEPFDEASALPALKSVRALALREQRLREALDAYEVYEDHWCDDCEKMCTTTKRDKSHRCAEADRLKDAALIKHQAALASDGTP